MSDIYECDFSTNIEGLREIIVRDAEREREENLDNNDRMKYINKHGDNTNT
jgi:hypothetical protein